MYTGQGFANEMHHFVEKSDVLLIKCPYCQQTCGFSAILTLVAT